MNDLPKPITFQEAKAKMLQPLTHPYDLPHDREMLDRVLADCRRAGVKFQLVSMGRNSVEVWR